MMPALIDPMLVAWKMEEENPTVDVLDRLATTLEVPLSDFFKVPKENSPRPKPLRSGRRPA
jgi:transcriptional regulator with XRE-family HTH domain